MDSIYFFLSLHFYTTSLEKQNLIAHYKQIKHHIYVYNLNP